MRQDILNVSDTVESILKHDPRSRSDDKYLIFKVLDRMGYGEINIQTMQIQISIDQENMKEMPSFESITRCRRKLQENDLYLPSDKISKERERRKQEMKQINKWFDRRG